jgi:hypothetical protein
MRGKEFKFSVIDKVHKTAKIKKFTIDSNKWSQKLHKKNLFCPNSKKSIKLDRA